MLNHASGYSQPFQKPAYHYSYDHEDYETGDTTTTHSSSNGPSKSNSNRKLQVKFDSKGSSSQYQSMSGRKTFDRFSRTKARKTANEGSTDTDYSDPDDFFENFDKIIRVRNGIEEKTETKVRSVRRSLLDDFELSPSRGFSCEPDVLAHERFSARPTVNREKFLPHLDNVSYRPWNVASEYQIPDTISHNRGYDIKDITKELTVDTGKLGLTFKLEKLPDLKVPKILTSKPSSFNKLTNEGSSSLFDKINKFHENFLLKNRPKGKVQNKVTINPENLIGAVRNSQQNIQHIMKSKTGEINSRCNTIMYDQKESQQLSRGSVNSTNNDEVRFRVNSVQNVDENARKKALLKTDLSLDLGNGNKVKFLLKNLEQKTSSYYQGILNKVQNTNKENKEAYASSRSHYHKENISMLSNSSRDKVAESSETRIKEENILQPKEEDINIVYNKYQTKASRMKIGDIAQLYKGIRQSIRQKEQPKPTKNIKIGVNGLNPIKDRHFIATDNRPTSVPRR